MISICLGDRVNFMDLVVGETYLVHGRVLLIKVVRQSTGIVCLTGIDLETQEENVPLNITMFSNTTIRKVRVL